MFIKFIEENIPIIKRNFFIIHSLNYIKKEIY